MSSKEKRLEKIRAGRNNVRVGEIKALMSSFGFLHRRAEHGYQFWHVVIAGLDRFGSGAAWEGKQGS